MLPESSLKLSPVALCSIQCLSTIPIRKTEIHNIFHHPPVTPSCSQLEGVQLPLEKVCAGGLLVRVAEPQSPVERPQLLLRCLAPAKVEVHLLVIYPHHHGVGGGILNGPLEVMPSPIEGELQRRGLAGRGSGWDACDLARTGLVDSNLSPSRPAKEFHDCKLDQFPGRHRELVLA